MRVVFINRFYWPETPATGQLLTDLAAGLAGRGRRVLVITSAATDGNSAPAECRDGVDIRRIRSPRWAQGTIVGKAIAYAGFSLGAGWRLLRQLRRGDVVVAMTDPPLLAPLAWLIARCRHARLVHWIQDIHPDVAVAATGHRWLRVATPFRNIAWRGADRCVTLGREMADVVAGARVAPERIAVIPNWAPAGLAPIVARREIDALRRSWGMDGKFVAAYSGNLGRVHDLMPVIAAAGHLQAEAGIALVIIGDGVQRRQLESEAARRNLGNVRFLPPQPRDRLAATLSVGDIHLVTLRPGCERFVFPSKLYGIAAVGRPVVFVGPADCEIAQLVHERGIGRTVERDDPAGLAAVIRELADDPTTTAHLATAAAAFGRETRSERALGVWESLLDQVQACPRTKSRVLTGPSR